MVEFAGYEMPVQYEGIMAEHLWTREHAGLFDVSHMGQLLLHRRGRRRRRWRRCCPATSRRSAEGRMRYSLLLAENGGILDDLMVTRRRATNSTWSSTARPSGTTSRHLREHLPDDDHAQPSWTTRRCWRCRGRRRSTRCARLVPGVEALVFMTGGRVRLATAHALWISRSGYTGEDGFEISMPGRDAAALRRRAAARSPRSSRSASARAIRCGSRRGCRSTATTSIPRRRRSMADLGFALSKRRREEGGFPGRRAHPGRARAGRRSPSASGCSSRAASRCARARRCSTPRAARSAASPRGGFAPTLGAPIAMAYVPPRWPRPAPRVTLVAARQGPRRDRRRDALRPPPLRPQRSLT